MAVFPLLAVAALADADHRIRLFANPFEIAGDLRVLAQRVEGMQFFEQRFIGEEAMQGFVAGRAQIDHLTSTFGFRDEMMTGDGMHFTPAQGAAVENFGWLTTHKNDFSILDTTLINR